jgi:hypothetical protein
MWVGKATVFTVGLAVILALVFGVATTALGATGGNFILGQANTASTVSKLVSNVPGSSALQVSNPSTQAGSRALQLGVSEGKAPLAVNATAGTATNLSADELDGKDSSEFLAADGKAQDAAHADRADSAASAQDAQNADKLGGQGPSAFAGFGESAYAVGGAVTPCASIDLASISNISVSRPSHIYVSGSMIYFPGQPANSLKYGEITVELRDSANNTVASAGKAYGSTTGAEDMPISRQGVLMNGSNPNNTNIPFVAQPGNTYKLQLIGRSSSGTCDNNNPPYMKDRSLSYVLIGATR